MEKPTNLDQPAKEESNEALFNRWQQHRDEAAFRVLHDRLVPRLRRFLRRQIETKFEGRGLTTDAVEDILQNVFLAVTRCRAPVRSVDGLLHKAAKRYLLKHVEKATTQMRDHHRTIYWDDDSGLGGDRSRDGHDPGCNRLEDPKSASARQQARIDAEEFIERLPPPEAKAVRLVDLEDYTIPAAAKAMNLSESTTWSRVRSGRRRLKAFAATSLILVATLGSVADGCDLEACMGGCTAETDKDKVAREHSGHHESAKQRRKTLVRFLVRPVGAKEIAYRLALDQERPSIHRRPLERREASTVLPRPDSGPFWLGREEDGRVPSFTVAQAARSRSKVPRLKAPGAA